MSASASASAATTHDVADDERRLGAFLHTLADAAAHRSVVHAFADTHRRAQALLPLALAALHADNAKLASDAAGDGDGAASVLVHAAAAPVGALLLALAAVAPHDTALLGTAAHQSLADCVARTRLADIADESSASDASSSDVGPRTPRWLAARAWTPAGEATLRKRIGSHLRRRFAGDDWRACSRPVRRRASWRSLARAARGAPFTRAPHCARIGVCTRDVRLLFVSGLVLFCLRVSNWRVPLFFK